MVQESIWNKLRNEAIREIHEERANLKLQGISPPMFLKEGHIIPRVNRKIEWINLPWYKKVWRRIGSSKRT